MLSDISNVRTIAAFTAVAGAIYFVPLNSAFAAGRCALSEPCVFSAWELPRGTPVAIDDDVIAAASGHPCADTAAFVRGSSSADRQQACEGVKLAIGILGRCDIRPRVRLHVDILDEVHGPNGGTILGRYDASHDTIQLTRPAFFTAMTADTPYAALPPDDVFRSAVVHEAVHAIMEQNALTAATTRAALEYPSYAIQIESMPAATRASFLKQFDLADPNVAADIFSDAILMFDPYYFAARAYTHYKSAAGGCTSLTALLTGRVTFIAPQ